MNINEFKKNYYFVKNIYTINSSIYVNEVKYFANNTLIKEYLNKEFNYLGLKEASDNTEESKEFFIELVNDNSLTGFDEYHIDINFKKEIRIIYSSLCSLNYATELVNNLINKENDNYIIPIIHIDDNSLYKERGIIEGYYGTPWTHENHLDMIKYMNHNRLNTYMYAPKADPYHRVKWDELYPSEWMDKFTELLNEGKKYGIDIYYTISPGYHKTDEIGFDFSNEAFNKLFKKLDQFLNVGYCSFGLLLDDIDYNLKGIVKEKFETPGNAHSYICNKVYEYLETKVDNLKFVMCPTEYHELKDSLYRKEIREKMNKNIQIFYTGDNVCAEILTSKAMKEVKKQFGHNLMIWENFPVTDFTYGVRQYMAPIQNRTVELASLSTGYMINPMKDYEISKVGMTTCSQYAWNPTKYNEDLSFVVALKEIGEDFYKDGFDYCMFNYPSVLSYGNLEYEKELVNRMDKEAIIEYYKKAAKSANLLLKKKYPIISELKPWLKHVSKEKALAFKILNNQASSNDVKKLLKDTHFNGSELIDYLIKQSNLLTEDEYVLLIKKKRGNQWYRVWEHKRYGTCIS